MRSHRGQDRPDPGRTLHVRGPHLVLARARLGSGARHEPGQLERRILVVGPDLQVRGRLRVADRAAREESAAKVCADAAPLRDQAPGNAPAGRTEVVEDPSLDEALQPDGLRAHGVPLVRVSPSGLEQPDLPARAERVRQGLIDAARYTGVLGRGFQRIAPRAENLNHPRRPQQPGKLGATVARAPGPDLHELVADG